MAYDIFTHRHNFAVWAAAKAVQRNWKSATTPVLRDAVQACGIVEFLANPASLAVEANEFDGLHRQWCSSIQEFLGSRGIGISYGRAAKLVAVYLKAMVVVAGAENSSLAQSAHPPIDEILLKNLARTLNFPRLASNMARLRWTQLDSENYYPLVGLLRGIVGKRPFWMIEEHWTVTND